VRPLGDLPFLADGLTDSLELSRGFAVQVDDIVQGIGDLASDSHLRHRHPDGEVALPNGSQHSEKLLCVEDVGGSDRDPGGG
jgi:hypothetical protein